MCSFGVMEGNEYEFRDGLIQKLPIHFLPGRGINTSHTGLAQCTSVGTTRKESVGDQGRELKGIWIFWSTLHGIRLRSTHFHPRPEGIFLYGDESWHCRLRVESVVEILTDFIKENIKCKIWNTMRHPEKLVEDLGYTRDIYLLQSIASQACFKEKSSMHSTYWQECPSVSVYRGETLNGGKAFENLRIFSEKALMG